MSSPSEPGGGGPDPGLSVIMSEQRVLINLAYRLLGSLTEAEDAVQEAYARWYAMTWQQREVIENPGAWLTRVASRICLDMLGSARARRETYVAHGFLSRCLGPRSGLPGARVTAPTRPTASPWMSRSAWPSSSCSKR